MLGRQSCTKHLQKKVKRLKNAWNKKVKLHKKNMETTTPRVRDVGQAK